VCFWQVSIQQTLALLGVAYLKETMNGEAVMHEAKMWKKWDKRN